MKDEHKLWIDGAEMSVIATTPNGEMKAVCWGQTSATPRPLPTRDVTPLYPKGQDS